MLIIHLHLSAEEKSGVGIERSSFILIFFNCYQLFFLKNKKQKTKNKKQKTKNKKKKIKNKNQINK